MAPGANYMGGKRNAARARSKDTTGRVHKNYFGRQRLDILSKGLRGRAPSGGNASGHGPRVSASDIALSHARHLKAPCVEAQNRIPTHSPGNASSPSPSRSRTSKSRTQNRYRLRSSSGSRSSKILEALDTTEPLSMRAAMNKILSIPDLAGLSTRPSVRADSPPRTTSGSKRPRPADLEMSDHPGKEQKRQKSQSRHSCSPSSVFQQSFEELDGFDSMDVDDTAADESDDHYLEPEDAFYEPAAEDHTLHSSPSSAEFTQPETPPRLVDSVFIQGDPPSSFARRGAKLLPPPQNIPLVMLSSHSAGLDRSPSVTSPSEKLGGYYAPNAESKIVLHDNLYDYQDPWSAIGVILGLEEARDEIDDSLQEVEDVSAEILTPPKVDPALIQPKHFHAALSSNSAPRSLSPKNLDSTFLSYANEADHFELDPPAVVAAGSPQSGSDSVKFNNNDYLSCNSYLDSHVGNLHELETFQRDVTPERDVGAKVSVPNPTTPTDFKPSSFSPLLRPKLLANSDQYFEESNPTTPINRKPTPSPHITRDDERDMNLPIPSLLVSRPASSPSPLPTVDFAERFPKFTKFPSPLNLKRTTVQPSTYIRPVPPIPSPHTSYMSSTPPLSQHKPMTSHSPFCFERVPRQVEYRPVTKPADTTERVFNIERAEYPEARRITHDIQDRPPANRLEKAVVHFEERENTELDGPKPERFFGDLCLFADEIDVPESDD